MNWSVVDAAIEMAVDRILRMDPETLEKLTALAGKIIVVEISGAAVALVLRIKADTIQVNLMAAGRAGEVIDTADVTVSGTPLALRRLLSGSGDEPGGFGPGLELHGDVDLAQRVGLILRAMRVDWEEQLSKFIGDIAAHEVGNTVRGMRDWSRRAGATLLQDIGEYLAEETQLVPARPELDAFATAVDVLRDDADRLEKRIERLERLIAERHS